MPSLASWCRTLLQPRLQLVQLHSRHYLLKAFVLVDDDGRKQFFLSENYGAQPYHFEQGEEQGHQRLARDIAGKEVVQANVSCPS